MLNIKLFFLCLSKFRHLNSNNYYFYTDMDQVVLQDVLFYNYMNLDSGRKSNEMTYVMFNSTERG